MVNKRRLKKELLLELGLIMTLAWLDHDVVPANDFSRKYNRQDKICTNTEGAVPRLTVEWSFNPAFMKYLYMLNISS